MIGVHTPEFSFEHDIEGVRRATTERAIDYPVVTALVDTLAVLSGPLLGVGLLLLTAHSLNFINLAASLVYTFTVRFAAIQLTLYYFDLEARAAAETDTSTRPAGGSARVPGALRPAR